MQRSQNRRSQRKQFKGSSKLPTVSFIITRSDLLAPTKEHVDKLMPYMMKVLRKALGSVGENMRLGNLNMVSSHRGWWTKEVKENIRKHGGGVWFVGKTNVGKSSLISTVFPKSHSATKTGSTVIRKLAGNGRTDKSEVEPEEDFLLPPSQPVKDFPIFPIVSSRSGTTASPIHIPFENEKGEVIDLPGLARGGLENYVQDKLKADLVIRKRPKPERLTIKPGQSLLLGGLVRIVPLDSDVVLSAAPFIPFLMKSHVTSNDKAALMLSQQRTMPMETIAKEGIADSISSAGTFHLDTDVTKLYARSQHDRFGQLPYKILATDILIEGCGWVELVTQIRVKGKEPGYTPRVEVFSPEGKFVGSRLSIGAWSYSLQKEKKNARTHTRPKGSIKRAKGNTIRTSSH